MADTGLLSRRGFIVGTGATGLTIGILASCAPGANAPEAPDYSDLPPNDEVNAWVHIDHDDTVTVRIARSEMGQGTLTGLAQLVADELDCDWEKVQTVYPTPGENLARERVWRDYSTGGSQGIRGSQDYVREGAAAAKAMLIEAALRTVNVKSSPMPFVLWTGLGDFAISYQINAFTNRGSALPKIVSELHRNIVSVFNENGVQIMTPNYESDPEVPKIPGKEWDGTLVAPLGDDEEVRQTKKA